MKILWQILICLTVSFWFGQAVEAEEYNEPDQTLEVELRSNWARPPFILELVYVLSKCDCKIC